MYLYYGTQKDLIFNHYEPNTTEITVVNGPKSNATLVINAETSISIATWKVTIEAEPIQVRKKY